MRENKYGRVYCGKHQRSKIESILNNEEKVEELKGCFIFADMPEGHVYWADIANGRKLFGKTVKDKLKRLLKEKADYDVERLNALAA